mmetsp:Transcript_14561/g.15910  ORF Transcript_14561/g.15910 Transcript_14561/m.15910 type:complete len:137 (+) Transcript_14561:1669-2079(+)
MPRTGPPSSIVWVMTTMMTAGTKYPYSVSIHHLLNREDSPPMEGIVSPFQRNRKQYSIDTNRFSVLRGAAAAKTNKQRPRTTTGASQHTTRFILFNMYICTNSSHLYEKRRDTTSCVITTIHLYFFSPANTVNHAL